MCRQQALDVLVGHLLLHTLRDDAFPTEEGVDRLFVSGGEGGRERFAFGSEAFLDLFVLLEAFQAKLI